MTVLLSRFPYQDAFGGLSRWTLSCSHYHQFSKEQSILVSFAYAFLNYCWNVTKDRRIYGAATMVLEE